MPAAPFLADRPTSPRMERGRPTVTLSRRAVAAGAAGLLLLSAWSAATVWYFVAHDQVALSLLGGEAGQKRAYEDKLVALRTRLDEVSSRRMVEQELLENRLRDLLARQAAFQARQGRVEALADRAGGSSTGPGRAGPNPDGAISAYAPLPPTDRSDPFRHRVRDPSSRAPERRSDLDRLRGDLDGAERNLASFEALQRSTLEGLIKHTQTLGRRVETAIRTLGLDPTAIETGGAGGTGGPLLSASPGDPLEALLQEAEISLARLDRLQRGAGALPFGEPIRGEIDLSSGFGYRLDPFTRSPAMHTGLDFRAEHGAPARAAGAGRVVAAEFSGAYGNMVEIEHAQGVSSRYAHMSSIAVAVGQHVKAGAVLGRVGSTGRSTGPHLHFETRVNGDAVDPQRFLKAGAALSPVMTASR
jgi:murein DD-endopeptidase MepM/ murein hydrolase activator NlpD